MFSFSVFFFQSAAYSDLTEEEKAQKRLQFNSYVEEELAKIEAARQAEAGEVDWFFTVEPSLSYDSNVNLDAEKQSSYYRELRSELGFKAPRGRFLCLGPGKWGISAGADIVDYHEFDRLDARNSTAKAFMTAEVFNGVTLKLPYEFKSLYYPRNDQLDFLSHRVRPEIFHQINKLFSHYVYGSIRYKSYTDRRALTNANFASDNEYRQDWTYEPGYGWRFILWESTVAGLSAAWQRNDSNDIFDRYNDYRGYKTGGYVYRRLWDRASIVGVGGYDLKDYDARRFSGDLVETDHFFYFGSYLYLDLSKKTQFVASYLYKQNNSSDPAQEYAGHLVTLGVNVTL